MQKLRSSRTSSTALLREAVGRQNQQLTTRLLRQSVTPRCFSQSTSTAPTPQAPIVSRQLPRPSLPTISHQPRRHASSTPPSSPLRKTTLYDLHLSHGAKMVPFGGFHMPVQYTSLSVSQSHLFTRQHASLFDVGHMVQRVFSGPGATAFLQRVTPADLVNLPAQTSTLSCLMMADGSGGIVDDTIVTKLGDGAGFYVVTNAACREKDDAYFAEEMRKWHEEGAEKVEHRELEGQGLVALQGPEAEALLGEMVVDGGKSVDLKKLLFGQSIYVTLKLQDGKVSAPCLVSRGGYTGEDGFEISIPGDETTPFVQALLDQGGPERVQLAGLGARDSLRLEAGMCLYGHDLDETTTPVEGALSWIIPKERRTPEAGFYGAEVIAKQLLPKSKGGSGVPRRRVGLIVEGAPAREGAGIVSRGDSSEAIGSVTSGCPSPSLGKNIAMGYVKDGFHKAGTEVDVVVRGKNRKAVVTKMPFVPTRYWKGIAPA